MKGTMFNNERYVTAGVNSKVDVKLQILIWKLIDELEGEKDYLQVFEMSPIGTIDCPILKIIHRQEEPVYTRVYYVFSDQIIDEKIFVIDDSSH